MARLCKVFHLTLHYCVRRAKRAQFSDTCLNAGVRRYQQLKYLCLPYRHDLEFRKKKGYVTTSYNQRIHITGWTTMGDTVVAPAMGPFMLLLLTMECESGSPCLCSNLPPCQSSVVPVACCALLEFLHAAQYRVL